MPRFTNWDTCPFIPGRLYTSPDGARLQFRGHVFSPYDGCYTVEFFELDTRHYRSLQVDDWKELGAWRLVEPRMPAAAGWRLRRGLRRLLSPSAAVRAQAAHDIADLGEKAIPALPWLLETAHFDGIPIYDDQVRKTNPRAQARHALERLAQLAVVDEAMRRLPAIVDPGARPPAPKEPRPRLP